MSEKEGFDFRKMIENIRYFFSCSLSNLNNLLWISSEEIFDLNKKEYNKSGLMEKMGSS